MSEYRAGDPTVGPLDPYQPAVDSQGVPETTKDEVGLETIPMIGSTRSALHQDGIGCDGDHANVCLADAADPNQFADLIGSFEDGWSTERPLHLQFG